MLTYSAFCLLWAGLGLALFCGEMIRVVALNPDYWDAYRVVPYITLAYVLSASASVVSIGLDLEKRTGYAASTTLAGAALNIALNFILIPKYKMIGAAVATVISYVVLYFLTYFAANRFCRIPYENRKLLTLLVLSVALFSLSGLMADLSTLARIAAKALVLISFPLLLSPLGFYERIEIDRIKGGLRRIAKVSRLVG
jgi:O-antigen/teichoic acid export membrane protein